MDIETSKANIYNRPVCVRSGPYGVYSYGPTVRVWSDRMGTLMRPFQWFWGTGEQGHLFQGNRGTNSIFPGEQGKKPCFGGTREHVLKLIRGSLVEFLSYSEIATRNVMKIARSLDIHVTNNVQ